MALTPDETQRLARLKAMLSSRDGKPGYTRNVLALKAEIAAFERLAKKPAATSAE
jgi:hypothetical protein